ncbi:hypothetical protein BKA93DRAFT_764943 [Sparassis latifolia]
MHRDPATQRMNCLCGRFSSRSTQDLRAHVAKEHKRPGASDTNESSNGRHSIFTPTDVALLPVPRLSDSPSSGSIRMSVDSVQSPEPSPPCEVVRLPRPHQKHRPAYAKSASNATDQSSSGRKYRMEKSSSIQAAPTARPFKDLAGRIDHPLMSLKTVRKQAGPSRSNAGAASSSKLSARAPSPTPSYEYLSDHDMPYDIASQPSPDNRKIPGKVMARLSSFVPPPHPGLSSKKRKSETHPSASESKARVKHTMPTFGESISAGRHTPYLVSASKHKHDVSSSTRPSIAPRAFASHSVLKAVERELPPPLRDLNKAKSTATRGSPTFGSSSARVSMPAPRVVEPSSSPIPTRASMVVPHVVGPSSSPPPAPPRVVVDVSTSTTAPRVPPNTSSKSRVDNQAVATTAICNSCHKPVVRAQFERAYKLCASCREKAREYQKKRKECKHQNGFQEFIAQFREAHSVQRPVQPRVDENGHAVSMLGKRKAESEDTLLARKKRVDTWRDVVEYQTEDAFYAAVELKLKECQLNDGDVDLLDMHIGFARVKPPSTTVQNTFDAVEARLKGLGFPLTGRGTMMVTDKMQVSKRRCRCKGMPKINVTGDDIVRGKCGGTIELKVDLDEEHQADLGIVGINVILKVVHR